MWITNARQGGPVHGLRQGRRREGEVHGVPGGARVAGRVSRAPKRRRWASRAARPRAVYFDNVKVPVENVLGEIGRGHIIAFNILNLGRLKLGPFAVGGIEGRARNSRSSTPRSARRSARPIARVRDDPAQAGGDGDPHLRGGNDELPGGGADRGRLGELSLDAGGRRRRRC